MVVRGSYAKGVAKREEILRTALEVFAQKGYLKTSIRELADAANLSQAGLLHYFGSKEELLVEILRTRDEVPRTPGESGTPSLLMAMRENTEVPGLVQLFATMSTAASDPDHPAHELFVSRYARLRAEFASDIQRRIDDGELTDSVDPARLATIMIATADGLQVQWLLDPQLDMPDHIEYLWALFHEVTGAPSPASSVARATIDE